MTTNTATLGTIPSLTQYQPGALPISGQEIAEIASTPNYTSAASYQINIAQFVGKVPSVMTAAQPVSNDMVVFFQASSGLPFSSTMGNLSVAAGNVPTGGTIGQILEKNSSTNYDAAWSNLSGLVSASTGLFVTGSTSLALGIATAGVGNPQIRQGSPLSVIGVAGSATTTVADIIASAGGLVLQSNAAGTGLIFTTVPAGDISLAGLSVLGVSATTVGVATAIVGTADQVLRVNTAGTALGFGAVNLATSAAVTGTLPLNNGGVGTTTLTQYGVVFGNGTSVPGITAAGATGLPLVANGTAPLFQVLSLAGGGINTTTLTAHGVLIGAGTGTLVASSTQTAGQLLVGQNITTDPSWKTIAGDITVAAAGTATIANNAVTFAKFQQIGPGTFINNPTNATANAVATTIPLLGGTTFTSGFQLAGQTSGIVTIQPQQTAGTWNFNLPTTAGTTGYVLTSAGGTTSPMTWTQNSLATGFGLTGGPVTTTGTLSISTTAPPYGFDAPVNLGLSASILTGVLTVNFLNASGGTPTATSPILVPFQNVNATSGVPGWAAVTAALSLNTVVGASLGASNSSTPFRLWAVLFYQNATSIVPALINCSNSANIFPLAETSFQSTVQMSATATVAGTFYSPNGTTVSSAPFRIAGYIEYGSGLATAGTYSTAPTGIRIFGPGVKTPGDVVQTLLVTSSTGTTISTTSFVTTPITKAIIPSSSPNLISIMASAAATTSPSATARFQIQRGSVAVGVEEDVGTTGVSGVGISGNASFAVLDAPGTTNSTTYAVYMAVASGTGISNWGGMMIVNEIMG